MCHAYHPNIAGFDKILCRFCGGYTPFCGQFRRQCTLFRNSALNFDNTAQCTAIWNYRTLFGVDTHFRHSAFNLGRSLIQFRCYRTRRQSAHNFGKAKNHFFKRFCKRFRAPGCRPLVVCYPDCPVTPRGSSLIAPTSISNKRVTP